MIILDLTFFKKIENFQVIHAIADDKHDEFILKSYFIYFVKETVTKIVSYLVMRFFSKARNY